MDKKIWIHTVLLILANFLGFNDALQSSYTNLFSTYANMLLTFIFGFSTITLGITLSRKTGQKIWVYLGFLSLLVYIISYIMWVLYLGVAILLVAGYFAWKKSLK